MTIARDVASRVAVASRSFSKHTVLREELLSRFAHVTFNDSGASLSGAELVDFLRGHDRAIIALERIDDALLAAIPELKIIAKYGVGLDNLELAALLRRGVRLGWTAGVNSHSVAELTIALTLMSLRHIRVATDEVRSGRWQQIVGGDLRGRNVGIVGLGHVGKKSALLFRAFGCEVRAHDILDLQNYCEANGLRQCGLAELLTVSDVVSIHLPLDASTRGKFDLRLLERMKPGAILINTARGGIVDESAVATLLRSGRISAVAFDVFAAEPPGDHELLTLPGFLATPHIGGSSREAILAMGRAAIEGLHAAIDVDAYHELLTRGVSP